MSRRNNQNNQYNGNQYSNNNQYYGNNGQYYNGNNGQYYNQNRYNNQNNGQYYNQNQYNQNGQYYNQNQRQNNKFGLYDQPPVQNEKTKKKINKPLMIKIVAFALFAIIVLLIVFAINSCHKNTEPPCKEDFRQVGNDSYGYVCIPSDWVNFEEKTANNKLQYSDIETKYILTLDSLKSSGTNAKDFALSIAEQLQNAGIEVQGSEAKIGEYDAYQVYGLQSEKNIWVLVYCFETKDGVIHYVGVEGPDKTNEAFKIPESFVEKKEN